MMISFFGLAVAFLLCADFHIQYARGEIFKPVDLNPGDQYQIIFVTEGTLDATSPEITVYNAFVTDEAARSAGLPSNLTWTAVASTPSTNARDNAVAYDTTPIIPIYNTHGERIAAGKSDLWDGAIQNAINYDQFGTTLGDIFVWTGSNPNGTKKFLNGSLFGPGPGPLGSPPPEDPTDPRVVFASSTKTDTKWMKNGAFVDYAETHSLYALSSIAVVVPEPGTLMLFCIGTLGFVFFIRRQ
jgi:hypothetical protein